MPIHRRHGVAVETLTKQVYVEKSGRSVRTTPRMFSLLTVLIEAEQALESRLLRAHTNFFLGQLTDFRLKQKDSRPIRPAEISSMIARLNRNLSPDGPEITTPKGRWRGVYRLESRGDKRR